MDREAHKAKRATLNNNEGKQVILGDGTYINEFDTVAKEIREGKRQGMTLDDLFDNIDKWCGEEDA